MQQKPFMPPPPPPFLRKQQVSKSLPEAENKEEAVLKAEAERSEAFVETSHQTDLKQLQQQAQNKVFQPNIADFQKSVEGNENLGSEIAETEAEKSDFLRMETEFAAVEKQTDFAQEAKLGQTNPLSKKDFMKSKSAKKQEKSIFDWCNFVNWAGFFLSLGLIAIFVFLLLGR